MAKFTKSESCFQFIPGKCSLEHFPKLISILVAIYLLFCASVGFASEMLKIRGMGGVSAALKTDDPGLFGNPASLLQCQDNVLSATFSIENFEYEKLKEKPGEQFRSRFVFLSQPSVYYSRIIGNTGFSAGILSELSADAHFTLKNTKSDYIVNERRFSSDTDLLIDYDLLWERQLLFGIARELTDFLVGTRIKFIRQRLKIGQRISALNLESVHDPKINPNDPRELIPAIIDNLDIGNPAKYVSHENLPEQDKLTTGFEIDLGGQREFNVLYPIDQKVLAGVLVENLIQYNLIKNHPTKFRIGFYSKLTRWLEAELDLFRVSGSRGLDLAAGVEAHGMLSRWAKVGGAFRVGIARVNSEGQFSTGFRITLGSAYLEYSLIKKFSGEKIKNARHLFASTVRF